MRFISVLVLFLIFCSCSETNQPVQNESDSELNIWFKNFPEQPFLDLNFQDEIKNVKENLTNSGWYKKDEQNNVFTKGDSVNIYLNESEKLNEFKVAFINKNGTFLEDCEALFEEKAQKTNKNDVFSVYTIQTINSTFELTVFNFEEMIRFHFKPKALH